MGNHRKNFSTLFGAGIPVLLLVLFAAGCATIEGMIEVDALLPETVYISPAIEDGNNDFLSIPLDIVPEEKIIIRGYRFTVVNKRGIPVYLVENSIPVPKPLAGKKDRELAVKFPRELVWSGKDFDGDFVPDGEYTYFAEAWDGTGNEGRSPDLTVVVDNTPPGCVLTSPYLLFSPNNDGRRDAVQIAHGDATAEELWTAVLFDVENREIVTWEWEALLPEMVEWDGYGENGLISPDGIYRYTVTSTDRAGNSFSADLEGIQVDTRPSPVTLNSSERFFSPNGDGVKEALFLEPFLENREKVINWTIEIVDEKSVVRRSVSMEGLPPGAIEFDGAGDDGSILSDGAYKAVLRVLYQNGNLPEAESETFTIDTVFPKIENLSADLILFSPDGDGNKDFVTISQKTSVEHLWEGTVVDQKKNAAAVWEWIGDAPVLQWFGRNTDGKILPNGTYSYLLTSEDPAGNKVTGKLDSITIDTRETPVTLQLDTVFFSPNGDGKKDTLVIRPLLAIREKVSGWKLTVENSTDNTIRTFRGNGFPPAEIVFDGKTDQGKTAVEGSYRTKIEVTYEKGNIATGVSPAFNLDITRPSVTVNTDLDLFSPNGDGRKDSVQINQSGSGEDLWEGNILNATGVQVFKQTWKGKPLPFTWNGKTGTGNAVADGQYEYVISSTDQAGNSVTVRTGKMAIDNRATPVTITAGEKSFSPNGDGVKDSLAYSVSTAVQSGISGWFVTIVNKEGKPWKTFTGSGTPPSRIEWNGQGSDGRVLEGDFTAELTVEYDKGDVSKSRTSGSAYIDITSPSIVTTMKPLPFSPDGDGADDTLRIELSLRDRSRITGWQMDIIDPYRNLFKRYKGNDPAGTVLNWNGRSDNGELVQSAEDYTAVITATDELGNTGTIQRVIPVDILVIKDGDKLKIIISSIYFKPYTADFQDRTVISPERVEKNIATINRLAEVLKKYNEYTIQLEGHAVRIFWDNPAKWQREESETLAPLSLERAGAIKKALVERGIGEKRLVTSGYGGTQPVVPHSDLENRWKNRRVEFILVK